MLNDKSILVTGGTGSFGKKFVEYVIKNYKPRKLIIFSRDELKQFEMNQRFSDKEYPFLRYFIGDVRDKNRLYRAVHDVDYIIHAAALKQVPAAEYNPFEAIQTNIIGAQNVIEVAIDNKVKRVVALSTDKAVSPINLYGATKLCLEKLFIASNSYGAGNTKFSVARYGNVIGSRGSVIPYFQKMKVSGELPITDNRMTRFWLTLEQGVKLVIFALENLHGGEIFIPKIPSMRILDLAKSVAPECKIREVGIRPGEKIDEVLISKEESRRTVDIGKYFVVQPEFTFWKFEGWQNGKTLPQDFEYSSGANSDWLTVEQLQDMVHSTRLEIES